MVYRLALAKSQKHARQLIVHGHVTVNGKKVNAPSYLVSALDKIELKANEQNTKGVELIENAS